MFFHVYETYEDIILEKEEIKGLDHFHSLSKE